MEPHWSPYSAARNNSYVISESGAFVSDVSNIWMYECNLWDPSVISISPGGFPPQVNPAPLPGPPPPPEEPRASLGPGTIILIVVGCVAFAVICGGIWWFYGSAICASFKASVEPRGSRRGLETLHHEFEMADRDDEAGSSYKPPQL